MVLLLDNLPALYEKCVEYIKRLAVRKANLCLRKRCLAPPGRYRAVIVLRDIGHLSVGDAAEVLGLTQGNIKKKAFSCAVADHEVLAGKLGLLSKR